jgi:hypothetical protein
MSDDAKILHTGDAVQIECDGRNVSGTVILASENGRSLLLKFEAILDGCVGLMPVLRDDDGGYHSVVTGILVKLRK